MGNRAYLIKTSEESSEALFEANNAIPLFWLNLLDTNTIKKTIEEFHHSEDTDTLVVGIEISKKEFMKNLYSGTKYIEHYYNDKINLYNDFTKYLNDKFDENDTLALDVTEIANFTDPDRLIYEIKYEIQNIEEGRKNEGYESYENNVFLLVGNDEFLDNQFQKYSTDYSAYCENSNRELELHKLQLTKQQYKEKQREKRNSIFMCIVGLAFIAGGIFGIIKAPNGLFKGIAAIILGGVFLLFGILKLKKII